MAELNEHETFLDHKMLEHEELKTHHVTLKSFVLLGQLSERRMEYITSRIQNSIPNRISLFQRRVSAFKSFRDILKLKEKVSYYSALMTLTNSYSGCGLRDMQI